MKKAKEKTPLKEEKFSNKRDFYNKKLIAIIFLCVLFLLFGFYLKAHLNDLLSKGYPLENKLTFDSFKVFSLLFLAWIIPTTYGELALYLMSIFLFLWILKYLLNLSDLQMFLSAGIFCLQLFNLLKGYGPIIINSLIVLILSGIWFYNYLKKES